MKKPKYSMILPVLNGADTLKDTLPEMLKIDRDDVEFVISNNLSEDETREIILDQNDKRVKYFEPDKRLNLGGSLTFALDKAKGDWQGYIGHDDHLFPSRYDYLDKVIAEFQPQLIKGECLSYTWPDYFIQERSNSFSSCHFNKDIEVFNGMELAQKLINTAVIPGGGMWLLKRSVFEKIWEKTKGKHVVAQEFFNFRAGALLSDRVVYTKYPLMMQGAHNSGSNIPLIKPKEASDPDLEPFTREYCPFKNAVGLVFISMDGAMQVVDVFKEQFPALKINKWYWLKYAKSGYDSLIKVGLLPPSSVKLFYEGRKTFPLHLQIMSMFREIGKDFYRKFLKKEPVTIIDDTLDNVYQSENSFGWPHHLKAELFGLKSMKGAPAAIEKYFEDSFHFKEL